MCTSLNLFVTLVSAILILPAADADYRLSYSRYQNNITLTCVNENENRLSMSSNDVPDFLINGSISLRDLDDIDLLSVESDMVKFELLPKYEGTFVCGFNGSMERSNVIGPFVANPQFSPRWPVPTNYDGVIGEDLVLDCPLQRGALEQYYKISWTVPYSSTDQLILYYYNFSLIIYNFQLLNSGRYQWNVTVHDTASGQRLTEVGIIRVYSDSGASTQYEATIITVSLFTTAIVFGLVALICFLWREIRKCNNSSQQRSSPLESTQSPLNISATGDQHTKHPMRDIVTIESFHTFSEDQFNSLKISQDLLGAGAFGSVFRATYKGHLCAAKLLTHHAQQMMSSLPATGCLQVTALESFRKECKFLESLTHDNIVHYIATLNEPKSNLPILVMDLLDCSLKKYLSEKSELLQIKTQISLCHDVSSALVFLHSKDIVHRDLCDDNVLLKLTSDIPIAKVSDFGMSRIINNESLSATLTTIGHRQGYLPPEATKDPEISTRYGSSLDIFSFGAIASQIVTVSTQFKSQSQLRSQQQQIEESHPMKSIISRCLCEDMQQRPIAAEVYDYIRNVNPKIDIIINQDDCTELEAASYSSL